jgi:hypothetical protein
LVGIGSAGNAEIWNYEAQPIIFATSSSERMRVDSAGDFLVAKTSLDVATVGHELRASGYSASTRDGSTVGSYTRLTSDGTILEFRKDSAVVGSIGTQNLLIGKSSSTGVGTGNIEVSNASSATVQIEGGTNEWSMLVSSSADALRFYQDSTERMRIDSSGNIGIGSGSPTSYNSAAQNLVIKDTGDVGITISAEGGGDSTLMFADGTGGTAGYRGRIAYDHAQDAMRFDTGATERMRLLNGGDLIIGGASFAADGALSISPNHDDGAAVILFDRGATSATSDVIRFENGGSTVGQIKYNSSTVSYDTSSDYRLKENVVEMSGALDRVNQLQPKRFNFISDANKTVDGFLAHEVQDIVPEAISGEKDGVDSEGNPDYQCIDHSKLVPLLTKAIQEQQAQIDALQSEINLLKGE